MLKLEHNTHKYYLNDHAIPGVNEILEVTGFINLDGVPVELLERSRDIGEMVHLSLDFLDRDILDESTIDYALEGYINAYRAFLNDHTVEFKAIEEKMSFKDLYAGTVDRVCLIDGVSWTIDIKTGGKYRHTRLQTAAYQLMTQTDKRGALYLSKDETYKLCEHTDDEDRDMWMKCVDVFHWMKPRYRSKKWTSQELEIC